MIIDLGTVAVHDVVDLGTIALDGFSSDVVPEYSFDLSDGDNSFYLALL